MLPQECLNIHNKLLEKTSVFFKITYSAGSVHMNLAKKKKTSAK